MQTKELHTYVKWQTHLKNKLMSWRVRSRGSLRKQMGGMKEKSQDRADRRGNTKIRVIEDQEGKGKVNERENI